MAPPQVQTPAVQPSASEPHAVHEWPPVPQAVALGVRQAPAAVQHPLGHDAASHTQAWFEQTCPGAHAADWPHWQTPADEQLSAFVESQVLQMAPVTPQLVKAERSHPLPEQHPFGHEVALHMHMPFEQA